MLQLNDIRVHRGGRLILTLDNLRLAGNELTVILGHNGSGKSTLMNLLARQAQPDSGRIELDGQPIGTFSQRDFARRIAFLPQRLPEVAGLTVRELVRLGRFPWRGLLGRWQHDDQTLIEHAMQQTDVAHYADHLTDTLSGGERQRAWIAMLLAQQSPLILLDEPTSALDLSHQYELMGLLHELNKKTGRGIVVILHDINLATRFADRIVALKRGRLFFDGTPEALLSSHVLSELYDIDIQLLDQPDAQRKIAVVA
ncbi:iron complex transport system ATP-binding protein [Pseudomonas duriflava]|uniref:Iron complex transport system ATP-binding protein n=1 Tax=Pseudomonas duriflava TaxID=459528 RepID=A0A562Q7J1_9PSED|nr:ABC transporter ATP-binding protein [Pseudomonas duriflava]TWI52717.1 iron complex transport system ATP-binding protein [Pseudomonas duriflava]